jgi:hypothetical protein
MIPEVYCQSTEFNERLCSILSAVLCNSTDRPFFTEAILRKVKRLKELEQRPQPSHRNHSSRPRHQQVASNVTSSDRYVSAIYVDLVIAESSDGYSTARTAHRLANMISNLWHPTSCGCTVDVAVVSSDSLWQVQIQ